MLNRLSGFCSHAMTYIQTLVIIQYMFYKRPDISSYIADLSYMDKFYYDNIENMSNKKPCCKKSYLGVNKTIHIYRFEGNI